MLALVLAAGRRRRLSGRPRVTQPGPAGVAPGGSYRSARGDDTRGVPISRRDLPLVAASAGVLILSALALAAAFLFFLPGQENPDAGAPVSVGFASSIEEEVAEGGPIFQADITGGERGFWIALEDGELVALALEVPGREGCNVDWRGRDDTFVDCDTQPIETTELARYEVSVRREGADEGALLVDLDTVLPPPDGAPG